MGGLKYFSLFRKKQSVSLLSEGDNVVRHKACKHARVEIKITCREAIWDRPEGNNHGKLHFSIEFIQPLRNILESTQVTFSFDCHPTEDICHPGERWDEPQSSNNCRMENPDRRRRGRVQLALADVARGTSIERHIKKTHQFEFNPTFSLPTLGDLSLGSYQKQWEESRTRNSCWTFKSHLFPPSKYRYFKKDTDVRFDWKGNEGDHADYPDDIGVQVYVDFDEGRDILMPMSLTLGGELKGGHRFRPTSRNYYLRLKEARQMGGLAEQGLDPDHSNNSTRNNDSALGLPDIAQDVQAEQVLPGTLTARSEGQENRSLWQLLKKLNEEVGLANIEAVQTQQWAFEAGRYLLVFVAAFTASLYFRGAKPNEDGEQPTRLE